MKVCKKCQYYKKVYVRSFFKFLKEKQGYCSSNKNLVTGNCICKNFIPLLNEDTKIIKELNTAIKDIKELEKIYSSK